MSLEGKTIGLALSGGGYRATLFALGSLWRLNDAGILGKLDRITSVSGGAILAGILAHRWKELRFTNGRANNFAEVIAEPTQAFCGKTIDVWAGLAGLLVPRKTAGDFLALCYKNLLFGNATLKNLPVTDGNKIPKFIFYATNMQTGRSFRFRQDFIADYLLGKSYTTNVPLATVVAASSAFPPIFSPIVLKTDPAAWSEAKNENLPNLTALRSRIVLADGGVYDNMGLETLVNKVDITLVCDAGAPFKIQAKPFEDYIFQLGRVRDILIDQTRALRKRQLIADFVAGRKQGAYWGVGTPIGDFGAVNALANDTKLTKSLEQIPTRLRKFEPKIQGHLVNWGYALCDAALRTRAGLSVSIADEWPLPNWSL